MRVSQEKVEQFMNKIGDTVAERPEIGNQDQARRRHKLMVEELAEYAAAVQDHDLVDIADALGDLLYTVLGTASHHGINLTPIFEEIHRSNMTKERCEGDGFKLCRKGEAYSRPCLAPLLLLQTARMEDIVP